MCWPATRSSARRWINAITLGPVTRGLGSAPIRRRPTAPPATTRTHAPTTISAPKGVCAGTLDPDCVRCDNNGGDCSAVEVDQCHEGGAVCNETLRYLRRFRTRPNGTTCDDENACTQTDTCQAGVCVGGNPVVCTPLDQCHVAGTCDPETGTCSNPEKADGTTCDDDDACTQTDTCQAGECVRRQPGRLHAVGSMP